MTQGSAPLGHGHRFRRKVHGIIYMYNVCAESLAQFRGCGGKLVGRIFLAALRVYEGYKVLDRDYLWVMSWQGLTVC